MKKLILLISCFALTFVSCKKEDKDDSTPTPKAQTYEERVTGEWDLVAVSYDTEIPNLLNPGSPSIPVAGNGKDVSGRFELTRDPNEIDYNLNFKAEVDLMGTGSPMELPINFGSTGTWTTTSDDSKLIVTDEDGEETLFSVKVNEQNKQVFSSTLIQSGSDFGLPITLEVDILLTFERAN